MIPDASRLFNYFGTIVWGDLGPVTIYKSKRGKLVSFAKTWPKEGPTAEQLEYRQLFTDAAAEWQKLTKDERRQWELATLRAGLTMTGYNLFVHYQIKHDIGNIRALQRQTQTELVPVV